MPRYFPIFFDSRGKHVLVVGAGQVAARRIRTLLDFEFTLSIVAPAISTELKAMLDESKLKYRLIERKFQVEDLDSVDFLIAATDDYALQRELAEISKKRGIPASIADQRADCSIYFPAIILAEPFVLALTSDGESPKKTKHLAAELRAYFASKRGLQDSELEGGRGDEAGR